ncbi:hypothetical protein NPIL_347811, partial [Nephila pilipes]
ALPFDGHFALKPAPTCKEKFFFEHLLRVLLVPPFGVDGRPLHPRQSNS